MRVIQLSHTENMLQHVAHVPDLLEQLGAAVVAPLLRADPRLTTVAKGLRFKADTFHDGICEYDAWWAV